MTETNTEGLSAETLGENGEQNIALGEQLASGEIDSSNMPEEEVDGFEMGTVLDENNEPVEQEEETTEESVEESTEEVVEEESAGLFTDELVQGLEAEYNEFGGFTEESVEKLVEAGIPQQMIDTYLNGLNAIQAQQETYVFNMVGGQENYQALTQWAGSNLSEGEIEAFNNTLAGGDMNQLGFAIQGLQARYTAQYGSPTTNTIMGNGGATRDVYESTAQMLEDMNNPKYKKDEAFRASVSTKLKRSNLF